MTTHPHDDIEAFALGALDQQSAEAVFEHADRCATCAVLMADAMRAASALEPDASRPLAVGIGRPAALSRPRPRPLPWIVSCAAAAAAIALFIWNAQLRSSSLPVPIALLVHSHFTHHPLIGAAGAGSAKVIQALNGSWLYLVADGLKPSATYSLWDSVAGVSHDVGTFHSDADGQAAVFWQQPPVKIEAFSLGLGAQRPNGPDSLHWP